MIDSLEVSYGEHWGQWRGTTHPAPMSPALTARLHDAGEAYSVLLTTRRRPVLLAEYWGKSWAHQPWRVYVFDDRAFRTHMIDLEAYPGGWLRVLRHSRWEYTDRGRYESGAWDAEVVTTFSAEGTVEVGRRSRGPVGAVPADGAEPDVVEALSRVLNRGDAAGVFTIAEPGFGDWRGFAGLAAVAGHEFAGAAAVHDERPQQWRGPLRADGIEGLFVAGARHDTVSGPGVVELVTAGPLRIPSGQLSAADAGWLENAPRTVAVPPGAYPVAVSLLRFPETGDFPRVAAVKVIIDDRPVAAWQMALRPGEDPELLRERGFYGVGVDSGTAALFDATFGPLSENEFEGFVVEQLDQGRVVVELPISSGGPHFVAMWAGLGDGVYPLWVGRAVDGRVSCVVLDFLLGSGGAGQ